jgi:hypothetical protein
LVYDRFACERAAGKESAEIDKKLLQDRFVQAILRSTVFDNFPWDKLTMGHLTWIARDQSDQAEGKDCYAEQYRDELE